ncbi:MULTISPECIES: cell division protein SepF [Aminobacterium]|jgi:cell division inhibitor SepF|uniref:Cell division protein SepF n=1 Tax=Aminobacterium colombiense (strain DSM 12261 / ALA-1) TaxID=572547 RepID=D5EG44_AMICL|nr:MULTISPECIES: cell division protein SepF [Aminobacterium]MDD2378930.1 cell division protein SepF [Aminobacterium colombiense]ADE57526.1 hypothetical protein Amico_1409 [Aminobacterium colombiense DSM 12261]MDD3768459.1 cell division protein SepF [Aminobacterium colombiense]MDD4265129.1 cell division protein SepF [Aminobacterium colombiense]MDD4585690.1 cell division protein SepF [Aminobacterium colombiense]
MFERLMAMLGLAEYDYDDVGNEAALEVPVRTEEDLEERQKRVLKTPPTQAQIVICRGELCLDRREELGEALHRGLMVIVDLRNMERDVGQSVLDFLCGVAFAMRGDVVRVSPGVFIASPRKGITEEWKEEHRA